MKNILTPYLLKFALAATILTIIFRFFLSYEIDHKMNWTILITCIIYGISMFIAGTYFVKKDAAYFPIYDVGFRSHLATYIICNAIGELWFVFGFNATNEAIETVHITALIWGIFLVIHFIYFLVTRKKTINNLRKDDLFE